MKQISFIFCLGFLSVSQVRAAGGDDLMKALGTEVKSQEADRTQFKLSDSFLQEFFISYGSQTQLPLEVRQWSLKILGGQYADAAHLWTAIQKYIPEKFNLAARVANLYCLWKLELPQTFLNAWLEAIHSKGFRAARIEAEFERTISPNFDEWLLHSAVLLNAEQTAFVDKLDSANGELDVTLKAYAALRRGTFGLALLDRVSSQSALKLPLAETVILAYARSGEMSKAAQIVKQHLEPALLKRKDPLLLAEHYIEIARLLYQAGSMEGAAQYYSKVPNGVPAYLDAHEELTWVWLREGDTSHLRGELTTLKSSIYADRFSPELYLVRAISDLKLCFYQQVQNDFKEFVGQNSKWAKEITTAMKAENPPAPAEKDFYTLLLERAVTNRQAETERLKNLAQESIGATLPAVGFQLHWQKALATIQTSLGTIEKARANEYRRQWKNRQSLMVEAIRKMQFVRVEVLSQLNDLAKLEADQNHPNDANYVASLKVVTANAKKLNDEADVVFPFDGVYWPDELFHLRSVTEGVCVRR